MQNREFLTLLSKLQNSTKQELEGLIKDIRLLMLKYSNTNGITDEVALQQAIDKLLAQYYTKFTHNLTHTAQKLTDYQIEQTLDLIMPYLRNAGLLREAVSFYSELQAYSSSVEARLLFRKINDLTLNIRIKTLEKGSQKTIRNIITNAMRQKKGATEIADLISQYVKPLPTKAPVRPLIEYRKLFDKPQFYTPRGIPAGSMEYNSMRIARTETSAVYRNATMRFYENKYWVKGFKRYLSNRHPVTDECDTFSKPLYKHKEDIPPFHPNCLCDVRPVLMSEAELMEQMSYNMELARAN